MLNKSHASKLGALRNVPWCQNLVLGGNKFARFALLVLLGLCLTEEIGLANSLPDTSARPLAVHLQARGRARPTATGNRAKDPGILAGPGGGSCRHRQ